jgi:hypothetical protein
MQVYLKLHHGFGNSFAFHKIKTINALMLISIYLQTICRNSDTVRSILIIFSESLNISKAYVKTEVDY